VRLPATVLPSNTVLPETPTAASMRLDGGHPALDLVNTVYGQVGEPPEVDVLDSPVALVTFARRVGMADASTRASDTALAGARALRDALDAVLSARLRGDAPPPGPRAALEDAFRAALDAAQLAPAGDAFALTWRASDPRAPVHRIAYAALSLLQSEDELRRLQRCAGCRWMFLDRSRGAGRRWCSMADCGTEAKKRRYVRQRRERRRR
jgi:predicted RNA-binding Zn ribbon-like protein